MPTQPRSPLRRGPSLAQLRVLRPRSQSSSPGRSVEQLAQVWCAPVRREHQAQDAAARQRARVRRRRGASSSFVATAHWTSASCAHLGGYGSPAASSQCAGRRSPYAYFTPVAKSHWDVAMATRHCVMIGMACRREACGLGRILSCTLKRGGPSCGTSTAMTRRTAPPSRLATCLFHHSIKEQRDTGNRRRTDPSDGRCRSPLPPQAPAMADASPESIFKPNILRGRVALVTGMPCRCMSLRVSAQVLLPQQVTQSKAGAVTAAADFSLP